MSATSESPTADTARVPIAATDVNGNGIPDECELCGDYDESGTVDVQDYWLFIDAFGTCVGDEKYRADADFDGDECITLVDYQEWLMCYQLANPGKTFTPPQGGKMKKTTARGPAPVSVPGSFDH